MKSVILILSVCAFAAALVPRERRALNVEDQPQQSTQQPAETTTKAPTICAPQTPCGWATYKPVSKYITHNIKNTYCICEPSMECQINEDDTAVNAFVLRCRPPAASSEDEGKDAES